MNREPGARTLGATARALAALALLVAAIALSAPTAAQKKTRPLRVDATCLSCGGAMSAGDSEYLVEGRFAPLCGGPCLEAAKADPDTVLYSLQARSGLFDEKSMPANATWWGWFAFGSYVFAGLVSGAWCSHVAFRKGLPPRRWIVYGLFGNVVAVAALAAKTGEPRAMPEGLRKIPDTAEPVHCGACGALAHPSAQRCAACGGTLSPVIESEVSRARA